MYGAEQFTDEKYACQRSLVDKVCNDALSKWPPTFCNSLLWLLLLNEPLVSVQLCFFYSLPFQNILLFAISLFFLFSLLHYFFPMHPQFLLLFHPVSTSICFASYQILSAHSYTHTLTPSLLFRSLHPLCWPPLAKCHTFSHKWSPLWFETLTHTELQPPQNVFSSIHSLSHLWSAPGVMTVYLSPWREWEKCAVGLFLALFWKER